MQKQQAPSVQPEARIHGYDLYRQKLLSVRSLVRCSLFNPGDWWCCHCISLPLCILHQLFYIGVADVGKVPTLLDPWTRLKSWARHVNGWQRGGGGTQVRTRKWELECVRTRERERQEHSVHLYIPALLFGVVTVDGFQTQSSSIVSIAS